MSAIRLFWRAPIAVLFVLVVFARAHAAEVKAGGLVILDAWARATPAKAGGAFLTIRNDGDTADQLTGASSTIAPMVGVHETIADNGVMKMRPVGSIDLPPHQTVMLKPGGYHVMLMGLANPLKEGDTFPLDLTFAHAGKVTVTVTVKAAGAMGEMK